MGNPPIAAVASVEAGDEPDAVVVRSLRFGFPTSGPIIENFSLTLPRGSRCLLCGANGAGKTTLLQVRSDDVHLHCPLMFLCCTLR